MVNNKQVGDGIVQLHPKVILYSRAEKIPLECQAKEAKVGITVSEQ